MAFFWIIPQAKAFNMPTWSLYPKPAMLRKEKTESIVFKNLSRSSQFP